MRAIVTVIGKDRVGIIADVTALLAQYGVNVLDISQTVLQEYFTMIMLVDASQCTVPFADLARTLDEAGTQRDLQIDVRLYRPVRCHCPTVFPAVTGVQNQDLRLLAPVCGRFCLSELPVSCKPAAKHHDRSQQPDKYPMIQRFRHSAPPS